MRTKEDEILFEDWIQFSSTNTIPGNNARIKVKVCDYNKNNIIYPPIQIWSYQKLLPYQYRDATLIETYESDFYAPICKVIFDKPLKGRKEWYILRSEIESESMIL